MNHPAPPAPPLDRLGRGQCLGLALVGLVVGLLAAGVVSSPGYMDADYYYATGRELSRGHGFLEPFLWNYLDDPAGLPHPSHLYWMPLASLLAAGSMRLLGEGFRAAQLPFLLLTALLPPFTAALALRLHSRAGWARAAGLLAAFSGFYLPFFVTTDALAAYALLGGGLLWVLSEAADTARSRWWLLGGALLGLCHLARADAPLLLLPALYAWLLTRPRRPQTLLVLLGGYLVAMGPWFARNLALMGSPLNPGGARVLWTLGYDDLFIYPASTLTIERWLGAGLPTLVGLRLASLGTMLQRALAENGLVFLAPFMLLGAGHMWSRSQVRIATVFWAALVLGLALAFPDIGARGAYFHASAALMPLLWALAPVGVNSGVRWLGARRGWNLPQASRVFVGGAVLLAAMLTLFLLLRRAPSATNGGWSGGSQTYQAIGDRLAVLDTQQRPVAVNNPPGFFAVTEWPAVVIPNGDPSMLHQVVERYGVGWVVLDANHPAGLAALYQEPAALDWLQPITSWPDPTGRPVWLLSVRPATSP